MKISASWTRKPLVPRTATQSASCRPSRAVRAHRDRGELVALRTDTLPQQEAKLSKDEILRYSRHLIMPEVGLEGQLKLRAAKVLLIGAGGLGAPLGLYLAAAGVGRLGLVDFDVVGF